MTTPILQVKNITKRFPGVVANDQINLDIAPQEVHALLGENGAGKTTLMNIIYGLYQADGGQIFLNGQPVNTTDPNHALALGIGMVHQHFMLVPILTVTENLMLGHEETTGWHFGQLSNLNRKKVANEIRQLSEKYGLRVDPDAYVSDLSVGESQRVEIIKSLYRGANILILDEPTSVLTPQETDDLFKVMRSLIDQGKSVIFITHKLQEVMSIADRITVLRNGRVVGTTTPAETNKSALAMMMVGHEVLFRVSKKPADPGENVLEVHDLSALDKRGHKVLKGVNLNIRAGEILGIAGVQGNGQSELAMALTGLISPTSGQIIFMNKDITHAQVRSITQIGIAHVPEDRQKHGLVLNFPIYENLALQSYYRPPFSYLGNLRINEMIKEGNSLIQQFDVRTTSANVPVKNLSGGNQQKVILARELSRPIKLLIVNQPTRGLDVGSIEYIHRQIIKVRDSGVAVLLISAELDEIMSLSDRVSVMYNGQIVATLEAEQANREMLGLLMAGVNVNIPAHTGN